MLILGTLLLASFGNLAHLRSGDRTVFPFSFPNQDLYDYDFDNEAATRSVAITVDDGVAVTMKMTGAEDALTDAVSRGDFRDDGSVVANVYIAGLDFDDPAYARMVWGSPTIEGAQRTIVVRGRSADSRRPSAIRVTPGCRPACPMQLTVDSPGVNVVGVDPVVEGSRDARSLAVHIDKDTELSDTGSLTVIFAQQSAEGPSGRLGVSDEVRSWLLGVMRSLWPLALWVVLWRRDSKVAGLNGDVGVAVRLLLLLGVVSGTVTSVGYVGPLIQWTQSHNAWPYLQSSAAPAAAGMLLIWGLHASKRPVGDTTALLIGVGALGATLTASYGVYIQTSDPHYPVNDGSAMLLLGLGTVALLLGAAAFAGGLSTTRWIGPASAGAGLTASIAVLGGTYAESSQWASGILTLACNVLVVSGIILLVERIARSRPPSSRPRPWLVAIALLVGLAVSVPSTWFPDSFAPVSPFDSLSVNSVVVSLLTLGLTVAAAKVLTIEGTRPTPRPVLVLLTGVLLLRPEVQFQGVPWGLLAGVFVISWLLFDRERAPALEGPAKEVIVEGIQDLIAAARRSRTERDFQQALRRKISTAEIEPGTGDELREKVTAAFAEPATATNGAQQAEALSWSAEPSTVRRAFGGMLVASVIGAVLTFSYAAETLARMDGFTGTSALSQMLDVLLAFKYPWYGFAFGCLYPRIAGRRGLTKGLRLFVVLATSETLVLSVPWGGDDSVEALVLRVVQLAALCVLLGLAGDAYALRAAGRPVTDIGDLYAANRVVVWTSGIAAAVATAAATAMLGSAATLLVDRIVPTPARPPVHDELGDKVKNTGGTESPSPTPLP